jgi:hypothetical protein
MVMDKPRTTAQIYQVSSCNNIVKEIKNLERYYNAKVQAGGSKIIPQNLTVHFGSKSVAPPASCDEDSVNDDAPLLSDTSDIKEDLCFRWFPPDSVHKEDDYHSIVLKKDGYL